MGPRDNIFMKFLSVTFQDSDVIDNILQVQLYYNKASGTAEVRLTTLCNALPITARKPEGHRQKFISI